MSLPLRDDYDEILRSGITLLDVRAPVEFEHGTFAAAVNCPLLDNDQRAQVGKRYKDEGQEAAIALGHQLVDDVKRAERVEQWTTLAKQSPDLHLYCARGGLRSDISQQWMADAGFTIPRIVGGYKALRKHGIRVVEDSVNSLDVVVVSGRTGTAKTRLIQQRDDSVDLEGLANHRGSAFGRWPSPQPTQATFENALACDFLKLRAANVRQLVFEDEGRNVGRAAIPTSVVDKTSVAPIAVIEATVEQRVEETVTGYITESLAAWTERAPANEGFDAFAEALLQSLDRIRKRLGSRDHAEVRMMMVDAITQHRTRDDQTAHADWIRKLLTDYYDPMYDYQLSARQDRIVFSGSREAVNDWLDERLSR